MKLVRIILVVMSLLVPIRGGNASETYFKQIETILKFYETLAAENPNVQQFFELFGRDNEAELELILKNKFPSLNLKGDWHENKEAEKYIKVVYEYPERFSSEFLYCLKSVKPKLFSQKIKRHIEFPPKINNDFRKFRVITNKEKVIFQFSQGEPFIENIYLSDGTSIYDLEGKCINSKTKKDKLP